MLLLLAETEAPRAVLVCWDTLTVPTYRHLELPAYQAHRPPFDDELVEQLGELPRLVRSFGFAAAAVGGFEADDLLATAARLERERGGRGLVVTSDRDAYQVVTSEVTVLAPQSGGRPPLAIGPAEVRERYGVEPVQVPDFIALRGDPSDGILGARGIGAKTAAAILARFGDLETAIARRGELPPRQAEALGDPALPLHRRVATMDDRAPLDLPADNALDRAGARAFAEQIGAGRLAQRLAD
jgi:DNA polymerase-1